MAGVVGVWVANGGHLEELLAPEVHVVKVVKAARWRFQELAYQRWLTHDADPAHSIVDYRGKLMDLDHISAYTTIKASDRNGPDELELVCDKCSNAICDVEDGDTIFALASAAQDHLKNCA